MKTVKTVKGRKIDMAAMVASNEDARAVGNVPMNARGDRLSKGGNVVATVQKTTQKQYADSSPPKSVPLSKVKEKTTSKKKSEPEEKIISRVEKTRDDGTKYVEIEYSDGSIESEEI